MEKSISIIVTLPDILVPAHLQDPGKTQINISGMDSEEAILLLSQSLTSLLFNKHNERIKISNNLTT